MLVSAIGYLENKNSINNFEYNNVQAKTIDSQGFGTYLTKNPVKESVSIIDYIKSFFGTNSAIKERNLDTNA